MSEPTNTHAALTAEVADLRDDPNGVHRVMGVMYAQMAELVRGRGKMTALGVTT